MAADATAMAPGAAGPGRDGWTSRQRKRDAALRLLSGEDLETVARALGAAAATLSGWRDAFLAAGEASLATWATDGEELKGERLKARLGETLLERELLEAKVAVLEGGRPLVRWRSRPGGGRGHVRWCPSFGQVVKLGSPMKDGPDDGQAEAVFG